MAYAYLLSGDNEYADGVIGGMDYLLGRNPMDYSYVTGYGTHTAEYPHHRYWAQQVDEAFPKAPNGVLVGGPNSGMQDPWVQGSGWKKGEIAPQKCYLDNIEAWSVNECTINWNASLAWITGFTAQENGGIAALSGLALNDSPTTKADNEKSDDKGEKETITKAERKTDKTDKDSDSSKKSSSDDDEKGSNLGLIAIIAAAAVIVLISIEFFVYKMIKLKKQ